MDVKTLVRDRLLTVAEIRLAYLFGSAVGGALRPKSDVDIAILCATRCTPRVLDDLSEALSTLLGRPVDLVDLFAAPPLLAHEVVATGDCVLARDVDERVAFETRTLHRYVDTAHLRRIQHEALRERVERRG